MTDETSEKPSMPLDRDTVLKGVRNLPSLPAVVIELLQSIDNDDADTRQLAGKLERDQALAARVLRPPFTACRARSTRSATPLSCSACTGYAHWPRRRR